MYFVAKEKMTEKPILFIASLSLVKAKSLMAEWAINNDHVNSDGELTHFYDTHYIVEISYRTFDEYVSPKWEVIFQEIGETK